jgi:DNA-directed RNA polymerase omega subunit
MAATNKTTSNSLSNVANGERWPGIDSRYRLIVVAALRSKQLLHGSHPRIEANPLWRRNTSIALEEVKRGLVPFTTNNEDHRDNGNQDHLRESRGRS